MNRLERIQRLSGVFRYLLIGAATVIGCALVIALLTQGQDWVSLGDGRFDPQLRSGAIKPFTVFAVMAPIAIMLTLGVYWLQRLFGEYQAGRFFTDGNMRCYLWLVWLKLANFLYSAIWPVLLVTFSDVQSTVDSSIEISAGSLVELVVLLVIVHLLKEAQQLNDDNKAFV